MNDASAERLHIDTVQRATHRKRVEFQRRRFNTPDPDRRDCVNMFGLGPATKIYLGSEPVDMRKGFEGLFGLVRDQFGHDPLSGPA